MSRGGLKIWYYLFGFLLVMSLIDLWNVQKQTQDVPYSEFVKMLEEKKFSEVTLSEHEMIGTLAQPNGKFRLVHATRVEPAMARELETYGVKFSQVVENTFFRSLMYWLVISAFVLWLISIFLRLAVGKGGLSGGLMSVGKSKAKIYVETDTKVSFSDVAGADEAKAELKEVVEFLKDPNKFSRLGSRLPKGILLVGPPGTGKTLIAKAVAGEAGVPFFSTNGAEFVEMFVGVGAARVRDLFEQAKSRAPCIIFVDELDALGRARFAGAMHGNDEKEQTLNQLLVELDGFDSSKGIVLLAATNRPEILDPALLRSGRFDRQVLLDRPDKEGRIAILKLHVKNVKLDPALNIEKIASMTPGLTGADLANLINEASLVALRRNADFITEDDFTIAIERMLAGLEKKNRLINKTERRIVAYHEVGHALVGAITCKDEPANKISIIPRGIGALGYTMRRPTEDRFLMTREELENKVAMMLGGRAAERLVFNHLSSGCADDLDKATDIAWSAVTRFGMAEHLGLAAYERHTPAFLADASVEAQKRDYSDVTAREIDCAVSEFIEEGAQRALDILIHNRALLTETAERLIKEETLAGSDLENVLKRAVGPSTGSLADPHAPTGVGVYSSQPLQTSP